MRSVSQSVRYATCWKSSMVEVCYRVAVGVRLLVGVLLRVAVLVGVLVLVGVAVGVLVYTTPNAMGGR